MSDLCLLAPSQLLNSSTRLVPSSPIMRARIERRVSSVSSRRMRRCQVSVKIAGIFRLRCSASSSSHSPPSSHASSQVEHTSRRLETRPVILYFAITRSHFGHMIALVVSVVARAPMAVVEQGNETAVAGAAAHCREVLLDHRRLQIGVLAMRAFHGGLLFTGQCAAHLGRSLASVVGRRARTPVGPSQSPALRTADANLSRARQYWNAAAESAPAAGSADSTSC